MPPSLLALSLRLPISRSEKTFLRATTPRGIAITVPLLSECVLLPVHHFSKCDSSSTPTSLCETLGPGYHDHTPWLVDNRIGGQVRKYPIWPGRCSNQAKL